MPEKLSQGYRIKCASYNPITLQANISNTPMRFFETIPNEDYGHNLQVKKENRLTILFNQPPALIRVFNNINAP